MTGSDLDGLVGPRRLATPTSFAQLGDPRQARRGPASCSAGLDDDRLATLAGAACGDDDAAEVEVARGATSARGPWNSELARGMLGCVGIDVDWARIP